MLVMCVLVMCVWYVHLGSSIWGLCKLLSTGSASIDDARKHPQDRAPTEDIPHLLQISETTSDVTDEMLQTGCYRRDVTDGMLQTRGYR